MASKNRLLKIILYAGSIYYLIGAIVHFFGISLFPWFDANLYSPYHDSIIAMAALAFSGFFFVTANDPKKNIDTLYVIMISAFISGVLPFLMAFTVNFNTYNAPDKNIRAIIEAILLIILSIMLYVLKPNKIRVKSRRSG